MADAARWPEPGSGALQKGVVEGVARVVALEAGLAWLEPEPTTSCGQCATSALCGVGRVASPAAKRRFALVIALDLAVGERVIVGVEERALLKASGLAYGLPLLLALGAGTIAQWAAGSDGITMTATFGGLGLGLAGARSAARRMTERGQLAPRLMRRLSVGDACRAL